MGFNRWDYFLFDTHGGGGGTPIIAYGFATVYSAKDVVISAMPIPLFIYVSHIPSI